MRNWSKIFLPLLGCIIWGFGPSGCEGCGCSESGLVATVTSTAGEVQRDHRANLEQWEKASQKAQFFLGDGIRTKQKSQAVLDMAGHAELHVKESTQIRFMNEMPKSGGVGLEVESGEAELIAGDEDFEVVLSDKGRAVVYSGGRARLKKDGNGVGLHLKIGRAAVFQTGTKTEELTAGESIQIEFGATQLVTGLDSPDTAGDTAKDTTADEISAPPKGSVQVEVTGEGAKMRLTGDQTWQELATDSTSIPSGTVISLPKKTTVKINRDGEKATLTGSGEFKIGGPDEPLVQTGQGKITIDSAQRSVTVVVPGGKIVTVAGSGESIVADINTKKNVTDVSVRSGALDVHTSEGQQRLTGGEKTTIKAPTNQDKIQGQNYTTGPEIADFAVSAGESFVVHLSKPPAVVGFQTSTLCQGDAVVTIDGKRGGTKGVGVINVTLKRGRSGYKIRCLDSDGALEKNVVAKGRALVLRDSGKAKLPLKAPRSTVDLDGRRYKISYQNRLPIVKVRWPKAPQANSYSLHINTSSGKELTVNSPGPDHTFSSGKLGEGTHSLSFQANGTNQKSRTTTVEIRFDNAAPKASLRKPEEGGFNSGQLVTIKGIAMPGWTVSVAGGQVNMDGEHRFNGDVQYQSKYRGIALRLVQTGRGVHYYLRRSAGASQ